MALSRSLWFPSAVSALPSHLFMASALAATLVCKVIPSPGVRGPASYQDTRAFVGAECMYRAYRSESGWQLNIGRECGQQPVVLTPAEHPWRRIRSQPRRSGSQEFRQPGQACRVEGNGDTARGGEPLSVAQESVRYIQHGCGPCLPGCRACFQRRPRAALQVDEGMLRGRQGIHPDSRLEEGKACCRMAHRSRERQDVPRPGTGTEHRPGAVEGSKDSGGHGNFPAAAEVAARHGTVDCPEFPDSGCQPVRKVLYPGDRGVYGEREADHHRGGPGAHGIDVAEVLRRCLPADVEP